MKKLFLLFALLALPGFASAEPISAIAAIGSMIASGGIGALAAGGIAGLAGLGLTGGMMFAGGALGLVGSITGNKKLTQLGGMLGLAGGVAQAFNSLASAAGTAGEAAGAGAKALGQTAVTPAAEVAAETAGMTAEEALVAAQNAGLGTDDLVGQALSQSEKAVEMAKTPGILESGKSAASTTSSISDKVSGIGKWIKENKELTNLAGGILKGAGEAYASSQARKDAEEAEARRRAEFNASVTGMSRGGDFINPNADPTAGRSVRDPIRYAPQRGIPRRYATPTGG